MTASDENAEQIGKLQARVSRLEGYVDSLMNPLEALEKRRVTQNDEPQDTDKIRLRAPNGEFVDGFITKWEWLERPYQEYTEYESGLTPGNKVKNPALWNCGTIGVVVRLTSPTCCCGTHGSDSGPEHVRCPACAVHGQDDDAPDLS